MNISPLSYNPISYNRILPRQNPSFGSSDHFNVSNPNTDKAFNAAQKLLLEMMDKSLTAEEMGKLCGAATKTLPKLYTQSVAYTEFYFNPYIGEISEPPIIVVPLIERTDKIGKTIYVMNFVHELTHKYQIDKKEDPRQQVAQDTLNAGFKLREVGNDFTKFSDFYINEINSYTMRKVVGYVLGYDGLESYTQTGGLALTNTVVNANKIANALGYIDEDDFIANFAKDNVPLDEIVNTISTRNSILASKCVDSPTTTKEKIRTILIKYFKNSSKIEKEAYLTENKVAKLQGYDEKTSECTYKYHAMVEKAFDYYLNNM